MNSTQTATRLIELINAGKNLQAEEELYAPDVVSYEQDGRVARGYDAVVAKTKEAFAGIETYHGGGVRRAFVGPDYLLLEIAMDMTPKGGERMQLTEFGFYRLNDEGKVVEERWVAQPLA